MIDVADIDFEPRQASGIALFLKNLARALTGRKRLIIASKEQQGLDGTTQCASQFCPVPNLLK